jgi:hypothetical protein
MNSDVAQSLLGQMNAQVQFLVTLAGAVLGGVIALLVQILVHNSDPPKTRIELEPLSLRFIWACLLLEGLSILSGYMATGTLAALTPAIFRVASPHFESWSDARFAGRFALTLWPTLQFGTF